MTREGFHGYSKAAEAYWDRVESNKEGGRTLLSVLVPAVEKASLQDLQEQLEAQFYKEKSNEQKQVKKIP